MGIALVARAAHDGVAVPGGTYSGSRSSLEKMTRREDGATDFDHPRTKTQSCFGSIRDNTHKESILVLAGAKTTQNKYKS